MRLPFFSLKSDGAWQPFDSRGEPAPTEDKLAAEAHAERPGKLRGKGHEARFRLDVVPAYGYTCALTGLRVTTIEGATIIDAAHIHQFARSGNNELQNGIAQCSIAKGRLGPHDCRFSLPRKNGLFAGAKSDTGSPDRRSR